MYILNGLLDPYMAVPVIPTLLAVGFEIAAFRLLAAMLTDQYLQD